MIKYSLICETGHEFEGWFQNSGAFDVQSANSLISCPSCGTHEVQKALMAPAVATAVERDRAGAKPPDAWRRDNDTRVCSAFDPGHRAQDPHRDREAGRLRRS